MFTEPVTQPSISAFNVLHQALRAEAEQALQRLDEARAEANATFVATLQDINRRWAQERQAIREMVEGRVLLSARRRTELLHKLLADHNVAVERERVAARKAHQRALSRLGQDEA